MLLLLLLIRLSRVRLCANPQTAAHQTPLSLAFPGKKTGVGCHFLLQCMKVKSEVAQLCPTLSDPMNCSPPGSSIHGIFQARVLEWGAIAFSTPIATMMQISRRKLWYQGTAREFQKNIYFCFIDYAKAFDYVDHNKLWKILKEVEYQTTLPAS